MSDDIRDYPIATITCDHCGRANSSVLPIPARRIQCPECLKYTPTPADFYNGDLSEADLRNLYIAQNSLVLQRMVEARFLRET